MSTPPLTTTSYLVLGCLALGGPATPYDLKNFVTVGIGHFWSFPHSQLYSEPARLASAGLVSEYREQHGRRRRIFSITDAGRTALLKWLADPTSQLPEIRDVALLKLFFADLADASHIAALAAHQRDSHQERLDLYNSAAAQQNNADNPIPATRRFGIAYETAAIAFWASLTIEPPQ